MTWAPPGRRVLHTVADYGYFSQTFVADAMRELDRLGWEAWLVTRSVANRAWFPFPPDERLMHLPQRPTASRLADVARARPPWFWSPPRLDEAIARARPALVHAHFGWSAPDALRLAERAGAPLVVSFHGADLSIWTSFPAWELPRRLARGEAHRLSATLPKIAAATVPSPVVADSLAELGYRGPVEVLPPGVRLTDFPFRERPPEGEGRLIFVGRLVERKGVDTLLHALALALGEKDDLRLEICGDGPQASTLAALAGKLGLENRVRFRGSMPHEQVRTALGQAHVLALPSRTMPGGEIETLGVVVLEALASGVAVAATASGGIPHAVPEGLRRELVPEDDPPALAGRILELLADPEPERRAREGRRWVERHYAWEALAERTADLYERVLEPGSS